MNWDEIHKKNKEKSLFGRYITLEHIQPIIKNFGSRLSVEIVGKSVLEQPIYKIKIGSGKQKILMWSQMHGNETTTTKSVFDLLNFLLADDKNAKKILSEFCITILPILNPDGAKLYTRENANLIDLNRDAKNQSQPESIILRKIFEDFKPDFCFNLHDQRTIFGVGKTGKSSIVAFLAPSYNQEKTYNETRLKAVRIINTMNAVLQKVLPNQVARFDDGFNQNCVGDTFQSKNVPTILFEAGHFPNDYTREITRKYIFVSLVSAIQGIDENVIVANELDNYLQIPQNNPNFYDFIYKNVRFNYDSNDLITNFAFQYSEILHKDSIEFVAKLIAIGELHSSFGHVVTNCIKQNFENWNLKFPEIGEIADFELNGKKIFKDGKFQIRLENPL